MSQRSRFEAEEGENSTMSDVVKATEADLAPDTPMAETYTQMEVTTPRVTMEEPTGDGLLEEGEAGDKMDTS
jgi:hypothetical protein